MSVANSVGKREIVRLRRQEDNIKMDVIEISLKFVVEWNFLGVGVLVSAVPNLWVVLLPCTQEQVFF
jgi:hypothetical protein